ncbi:MAG: flagellar basal body protein FliL, partial [Rhodospirillales bacterium]|nr:flagellar basal body protein FliL [Rhodospirillales bacterium]
MSSAPAAAAPAGTAEAAPEKKKSGKGKLILLAVPLLLAGILAGLWFTGILPGLLGLGGHEEGHAAAEAEAPKPAPPPVFVDLPEIVANLNGGAHRQSYLKLQARLELAKAEDA